MSEKLFQASCFLLTGYMISLQFIEFSNNYDSSSTTFRSFTNDKVDVYPDVTICLDGNIYWEKKRMEEKDQDTGCKNQGDCEQITSDHYLRHTRELWGIIAGKTENLTDIDKIDFDKLTIDVIQDIVLDYSFGYKNIPMPQPDLKKILLPLSVYKSYQGPMQICITRKNEQLVLNQLREYDQFEFNSLLRSKMKSKMVVYLHYPGQLIRSRYNKVLDLDYIEYDVHSAIQISIAFVQVVKSRSNAAVKCNESLDDGDDTNWMLEVVKIMSCIPSYWKSLPMLSLAMSDLPICSTSDQYLNFYEKFVESRNFLGSVDLGLGIIARQTMNTYDGPCVKMTVIANVQVVKNPKLWMPTLTIKYLVDEYQLIRNNRAFGFESLWSQIGGVVGIFLGYSLLQVPMVIRKITNWAKSLSN